MRIAIPYEEGNVFQHFGKSKQFKLYTVEDGKIVSSEVISAGDTGHEALAGLLAELDVKAVICGGLGQGMMNALAASGTTKKDAAAASPPKAATLPKDAAAAVRRKAAAAAMRAAVVAAADVAAAFDSSYDRGEPLSFVSGTGMMIPGFDKAVVDMEPGDVVDIHLMPEEAYGMPDPDNVIALKIAELPGSENLTLGQRVFLRDDYGHSFPVRVTAMDSENITLDANHEIAGKELNFHIELISVED